MLRTHLIALASILSATTTQWAWAGEFRFVRDHYSTTRPVPLIAYEGEVAEGDAAKLKAIIVRHCPADGCELYNTNAVLSLNSTGGDFQPGIELAETLRELRVATVVENGNQCHSACALAFLGGSGFHETGSVDDYVDRFIEPDASVGFHSPFTRPLAGRLTGDQKLDLAVSGLRLSIADLARFLIRFNVDPTVVDRIILMDPDQFYFIETFADLFRFRINLPEFPVHLANPTMEQRIYNVCSRLAALHYLDDFTTAAGMIEDSFANAIAKTENGVPLDGFNILDRPLNAAWCGLRNDTSPSFDDISESFTISFARMVWRNDETYADPVLSFHYDGNGWSSADYRGGKAARSILRLGPLNHWLYDPQAGLRSLGSEARKFIEDDKRVSFAPFDRWRDSVLNERDFDDFQPGIRVYELGELRAKVEARPASNFDHAQRRYRSLRNTRINYQQAYEDAFFFEGLKPDNNNGFLVFGLRDGDASLLITLEYPLGADGKPSEEMNTRINAIACSATFGSASLPCS